MKVDVEAKIEYKNLCKFRDHVNELLGMVKEYDTAADNKKIKDLLEKLEPILDDERNFYVVFEAFLSLTSDILCDVVEQMEEETPEIKIDFKDVDKSYR